MRFVFLTDDFYAKHCGDSEILQKKLRPYTCFSVSVDGVDFAIPLRHHISHNHCFRTTNDGGLDYSKAVVFDKTLDVSSVRPQINQKDFSILNGKEFEIKKGFIKYLNLYKKAASLSENPFYEEIRRCSSLQYFKKELGL